MPAMQDPFDNDPFDFSEQILGEHTDLPTPTLTTNSEVQTSYILVNALLNVLIRKGIIYSHEVNALVAELYEDYLQKKRGEAK